MTKQRFYIDTEGNDDAAYKEAMKYACKLADENSDITHVVLLIGTKNNTGWFERLYGAATVKQLFTGVRFDGCKPLFRFETLKTYKQKYSSSPSEIVITCGLDEKDISPIDDSYSVNSIIVVPWLRQRIEKWVKTWKPTELRGKPLTPTYPEPSCIVKKAMEDLTGSINITTGITHSMDNDRAKTYILALHKYEPSLDANIVGAYLVSELGWDVQYASEIENLINTLNTGKYFQGGERTGLHNYYKRWKEECNQ